MALFDKNSNEKRIISIRTLNFTRMGDGQILVRKLKFTQLLSQCERKRRSATQKADFLRNPTTSLRGLLKPPQGGFFLSGAAQPNLSDYG